MIKGDFAGSAGFTMFGENWLNLARIRYVGNNFDINEVGFVPWQGRLNSLASQVHRGILMMVTLDKYFFMAVSQETTKK
ncbi:MAG: hypothetical protein IPH11_10010 [Ignavibacteriales bacterium]|nr:hypothetical protein [Ignavibacteriales bacterium]